MALFTYIRAALIGLIFGMLLNCSTIKNLKTGPSEPKLVEYREELSRISGGNLGDGHVNLYFTDETREGSKPDTVVAATCYNYGFYKYIDVNKKVWYTFTEELKLLLLAHEYIHCEMDYMDHIEGVLPDNCPSSIMNPTMPDFVCYNNHREYYIDQIKNFGKER